VPSPLNSPPVFLPFAPTHDTLPSSPYTGQQVTHAASGVVFRWNGAAWAAAAPGREVAPAGAGVVVGRLVTVVAGLAELTDPAAHLHCSGIVEAVVEALAVFRFAGPVAGFSGLTPAATIYAGAGGLPVEDPDDAENVIAVGYASAADTIHVQPSVGG
jgi:hypothetical protein